MPEVKVKKRKAPDLPSAITTTGSNRRKETKKQSLTDDATTSRALFSTVPTASRPIDTIPPYGRSPPTQAELMTTEET
jgi:hypothetical protein